MTGDRRPNFRLARPGDVPSILPMMRDFYAFERLDFDEERSRELLSTLISDEQLGRVMVFDSGEQLAGYMVLTFAYSLEFRGRTALLDELYVVPALREKGFGGDPSNLPLRLAASCAFLACISRRTTSTSGRTSSISATASRTTSGT